jgi:glycosyltransferase involved in cell wall biosynthesis
VEGWRYLHHSYALVAQSHCLCLMRRAGVQLRFIDLPFYYGTWRRTTGVFSPEEERALASLRAPGSGFKPEVTFTLQPERPELSAPHRGGRRFAFGTAEYRVLTEAARGGLASAAELPESVSVVTPSRWAALAFERFGMPPERVHIVPHGVDPAVFRPDPEARLAARQALGLADAFVFISAGAMTWNKGLDVLLPAFAIVAEEEPRARLYLKGVDALYPSREMVQELVAELPERSRSLVAERLIYDGSTYPSRMMADLLRAADVYVSPYRAEGFNMPVLEAAACGVPVICTGGGPTDEFTDESFARRIRSSPAKRKLSDAESGDCLEPDRDHLVELMRLALREPDAGARAGATGSAHVARHYTWERVTDRLLEAFTPPQAA